GTYDHIRDTGFLQLPHRTTLNQYTDFTDIGCGYNPDIIKRLLDDHLTKVPSEKRICSLLFDEMKIKSGLVFSRKTGKMVGFTSLGNINDEINLLEQQMSKENITEPPEIATHVLAVMARGIVKYFNYPIAYFATTSVNSGQLYIIIWDGVAALEMRGVKVLAFISDGASANRGFFALHKLADGSNVSEDGVVFWTPNRFDKARRIYFFSDVPHLIKTLWNNLKKSSVNRTRNLMVGGKEIRWAHIRNAYEMDLNKNSLAPGLRKLHKITFDHIHLTPRLRMRVNLAAQVLSKTMADYLELQGHEHTKQQNISFEWLTGSLIV
uniref:Transposable element P transposase n=1 Tax=Clytia hemisphaerica TaxID=252671 RepID=A0A7M5VCD5_9CNID